MSTQISLKLSDKMFASLREYADALGYDTTQDFIRETLRERLFEHEQVSGRFTAIAAEKSLAKHWLSKEEDRAWAHLQKRT